MPVDQTTLGPFIGGVNNRLADHAMMSPDGSLNVLRHANNVVLDNSGRLSLRQGFSVKSAVSGAHSGFECDQGILYVLAGTLKLFDPDSNTTSVIKSGLSNTPMAYVAVNGTTYFSNGLDKGCVAGGVFQEWGIQPPNGTPILSVVAGALPKGTYSFFLTHELASGEESGTGLGSSVTTTSGQGITVSGIGVPPSGVVKINVYGTRHNGEVYYQIAALNPGVSTFNYLVEGSAIAQVSTMFLCPPPPGNVLAYSNARIYTAFNNVVCYTEPLAYGHYRPSQNYMLFPETVKIMAGVTDGLYVVADKTYFLAGNDPTKFALNPVLPYSGAVGSLTKSPLDEDVWFWYGDKGLVRAGRGGEIKALQENALSLEPATTGATMFMEQDGVKQLVSLSVPKGFTSSAAAQGFVDMEVRRKGL